MSDSHQSDAVVGDVIALAQQAQAESSLPQSLRTWAKSFYVFHGSRDVPVGKALDAAANQIDEQDRRIKQLETFGTCPKCGAYVFSHETCDRCGTKAEPAVIESVLVEKDQQLAALTAERDRLRAECQRRAAALLLPISDICQQEHIQNCQFCERMDCGDNTSKARKQITDLTSERDTLRERVRKLEDVLQGIRDHCAESVTVLPKHLLQRIDSDAKDALATQPPADLCPPFDLVGYIVSQQEWSERTFGPGRRTKGLIEHITKELREIEQAPEDVEEYIDVVILALDGAWRSGHSPDEIVEALSKKQAKNRARKWPKPGPEDKAIEHIRDDEPPAEPGKETGK